MKKPSKNISILLILSLSQLFLFQSAAKANQWEVNPQKVAVCNGYETNKFDKKAEVGGGGWTVAWADDITETDVGQGVVAGVIDVYGGSGAALTSWARNLVQRTLTSLGKDLTEETKERATEILIQSLKDAFRGESAKEITKQFDTVDFKGGAIRYSGRNRALCQTVSTTWGLKPYVAFRVRSSNPTAQNNDDGSDRTIQTSAGLCLDPTDYGANKPGAQIVVWNCNGDPNQEFTHRSDGTIQTSAGLCLDPADYGANKPGAQIVVWDCNGDPNQKFTHRSDGTIQTSAGLCLDPTDYGANKPGAQIVVWDCNGDPNQEFSFR